MTSTFLADRSRRIFALQIAFVALTIVFLMTMSARFLPASIVLSGSVTGSSKSDGPPKEPVRAIVKKKIERKTASKASAKSVAPIVRKKKKEDTKHAGPSHRSIRMRKAKSAASAK